MSLFALELKLLLKNRAVVWLCLSYLGILLVALALGGQRYQSELDSVSKLQSHYQADKQERKQNVQKDGAGYAAYYLFQPVAFAPAPWSALFSGERVESLNLQRVRLLAVHGQIHGSPIRNPEHSALGVLDAGFVWLYLLPVLIGLISVTCVADDRRLGRWSLLSASTSGIRLIARRLAVRFALVLLMNTVVLLLATVWIPLPVNGTLAKVWLILFLYQILWLGISAVIVFFYFNARKSILAFIGVWVTSVWLMPSLHYLSKLESESFNTGVELLVRQRQDMNDSWDRDKQADFRNFLERYPDWRETASLGDAFDWKWYFAMQKSSDNKVTELAESYFESRTDTHSPWQWLSPTLIAQSTLEDLADTGAHDQQAYLQRVVQWHGELQNFWFPYFFFDKPFQPDDLDGIPEFTFRPSDQPLSSGVLYFLVVIAMFGSAIAFISSRERWLGYSGARAAASGSEVSLRGDAPV